MTSGKSVGSSEPQIFLYNMDLPSAMRVEGHQLWESVSQTAENHANMSSPLLIWACELSTWPVWVPLQATHRHSLYTLPFALTTTPRRLRTHKHAPTPLGRDSSINSGVWPTPGP